MGLAKQEAKLFLEWADRTSFTTYIRCFIIGPFFLSFIIHSNDDQFTRKF